jgi:uncharacterized phiE125 gp8 family phage protein
MMELEWKSLKRTVASFDESPTVFPVSLAELKDHVRVDGSSEDDYLEALLGVATEFCENATWRAFLTQTWEVKYDGFPAHDDDILLPRPPLQSVSSIVYIDSHGVTQTLAASEYQVDADAQPARLRPARGKSWPSTRSNTQNTVTVTQVAGYGDAASDVPRTLRHAIKFLAAHLYEERQPVVVGSGLNVHDLPMGIQSLLRMNSMRGW